MLVVLGLVQSSGLACILRNSKVKTFVPLTVMNLSRGASFNHQLGWQELIHITSLCVTLNVMEVCVVIFCYSA